MCAIHATIFTVFIVAALQIVRLVEIPCSFVAILLLAVASI